ncbi:MAG: glycerate kinase [Chloroflexota bacterium]
MKILIAPAAFKGSLAAIEVAAAMATGARAAGPDLDVVEVPLADGGEGTAAALVAASGGELRTVRGEGPLGAPVDAAYGLLPGGETAVIEMATASGLWLLRREEYDALHASTYGTGQVVRAALEAGRRRLIVGVGGSATVEGGAGLAEALGIRLLDRAGQLIGRGGAALSALDRIEIGGRHPLLDGVEVVVACDVTNPLTGPEGAAAVFGPQKGASAAQVALLDTNLAHLAAIIERDLGVAVAGLPGAGAAGGLAAGLIAFLGARVAGGFDTVAAAVDLPERVRGCDLILTGEGRVDGQTLHGKVIAGIARVAHAQGVPVVVLAGGILPDAYALHDRGVAALLSVMPAPLELAEAEARARELIARAAEEVVRLWRVARHRR